MRFPLIISGFLLLVAAILFWFSMREAHRPPARAAPDGSNVPEHMSRPASAP